MAPETYDVGDRPVLTATFRDGAETLTAMTAITFKIINPVGAVVTNTILNATSPSTGVYDWQIPTPFDLPGRWALRAEGTSPIQTAAEVVVQVRKSAFS